MGLSGRVPHRVDAATKTALLGLLDHATGAGWTLRRACQELELGEVRAHRWIARRALGQLADKTPGGSPMHGLLDAEAAEILALFDEWGQTDRSHRKLAHRGSYLHRVWVSPSSVRRVLFLADKHFRPLPRPGRSQRKPFPDWVDYKPNSIWIYDTTHFTRAGMAVLIIQDLVSRKWITEVVSVEESNADRSGLDRELQRAPQSRVPAPARHRGPRHPARRTGRHPRALEFGPTACRHRICDTQRRTRRTRRGHSQSTTSRTRTSPKTPPCLAPPAKAH
nr:hypothetical protein [Mycolicibacterium doricum]